jgi:hypothetical protein
MAVTLLALREYLGPSGATGGRWSDTALTGALAVETAAQRARVKYPTDAAGVEIVPSPVDLDEALCRRVAANLARRTIPLGLTDASGDAGQRAYVPGTDPEVRRLEAPYRRLVVG